MYSLKGFVTFGALSNNVVGQVSPIGELSTLSLTYAKEKGQHALREAPDATLVSFHSAHKTPLEAGSIPVPAIHSENALKIGQWIFNKSMTGDIGADRDQFVTYCLAEFSDKVSNLQAGPMATNGTYWMPSWITYELLNAPEENFVRLWFSDPAFSNQYDGYEIEFIPPIPNIDDFFKDPVEVQRLLNLRSVSELMRKIEEVKGKNPFTFLQNRTFEFIDAKDPDWVINTDWTVVIYGQAGNNVDIIKAELIEWILKNSTRPKEDWVGIIPDIFSTTEFIIIPTWDQYSVPNRLIQAGMFSPTVQALRAIELGVRYCKGTGYTKVHIAYNTMVTSSMFKSIQLVSCGNPGNKDGIIRINQQFPDYMTVPSLSNDYYRMSVRTQDWVTLITRMLIVAEHMTEFSDLPFGMTRLIRDGVLYLVATYEECQYLVVARASMMELVNEVSPGAIPDIETYLSNQYAVLLSNMGDEPLVRVE